jgi:phosphate transport system substrate-binding protein
MDYVDDSKAELVKAYANFLISEEGQGVAAAAAGSAPISSALREKAQAILDSVE